MSQTNYSPIPFYASKSEWFHVRHNTGILYYPLIADAGTVLPFFLSFTYDASFNTSSVVTKAYNYDTGVEITMQNTPTYTLVQKASEYSMIKYAGTRTLFSDTLDIAKNVYFKITYATETFYSEIFTLIPDNVSPYDFLPRYTRITFNDTNALYYKGGEVNFANNWTGKIYLDCEVGYPQLIFNETVKDRNGYKMPILQTSQKKYSFTCKIPEYMIDVIRIIQHCSTITIISNYIVGSNGTQTIYTCIDFIPDITPPQENESLYTLTVEFSTDEVIKQTGKGYSSLGDFNNDYNNDFLT